MNKREKEKECVFGWKVGMYVRINWKTMPSTNFRYETKLTRGILLTQTVIFLKGHHLMSSNYYSEELNMNGSSEKSLPYVQGGSGW